MILDRSRNHPQSRVHFAEYACLCCVYGFVLHHTASLGLMESISLPRIESKRVLLLPECLSRMEKWSELTQQKWIHTELPNMFCPKRVRMKTTTIF